MVDLAVGSLVLRAAKTAYDLWRENRSDAALDLTDDARTVLKAMQSTETGIVYSQGPVSSLPEGEPHSGGGAVLLSRRTFLELEAKGLVTFHEEGRKLSLTHLGWILNPETGKADKVG